MNRKIAVILSIVIAAAAVFACSETVSIKYNAADVSSSNQNGQTFDLSSYFSDLKNCFDSIINFHRDKFLIYSDSNKNEIIGFSYPQSVDPIKPIEKNTADVKENFGAKGDGKTDDTVAIQSALFCLRNGGTINFPKGEYLISDCLIFFSNQTLKFEKGAVIKRKPLGSYCGEFSELNLMLASYTNPNTAGFNGIHNVVIDGATFDGNADIKENSHISILNFTHGSNIVISNCSFINGSEAHYVECNSSRNVKFENCFFDGDSYTAIRTDVDYNELVQIDYAQKNLYGPVYLSDKSEMLFKRDEIPCENIEFSKCRFTCNNAAAIGNHKDAKHNAIFIHDCEFIGNPKINDYVHFTTSVTNIRIENNIYKLSDNDNSDVSYDKMVLRFAGVK